MSRPPVAGPCRGGSGSPVGDPAGHPMLFRGLRHGADRAELAPELALVERHAAVNEREQGMVLADAVAARIGIWSRAGAPGCCRRRLPARRTSSRRGDDRPRSRPLRDEPPAALMCHLVLLLMPVRPGRRRPRSRRPSSSPASARRRSTRSSGSCGSGGGRYDGGNCGGGAGETITFSPFACATISAATVKPAVGFSSNPRPRAARRRA